MIQEPFYIWFERSGGFTGISTKVEIDSKTLAPEEAEKLKQLIDDAGFFEVPENDHTPAELPDQVQYKIMIEHEGNRHTVALTESSVPESFRPLIRHLTQIARSQRDK